MIALLLCLAAARAEIAVDPAPAVGVESTVVVTDRSDRPRVGATVRVVHRDGLAGEHEVAVGITDARGRVKWTPDEGGVASLVVDKEERPVAIAWSGPPPDAATLLGLLAAAGVGAFAVGVLPSRVRRRRSASP